MQQIDATAAKRVMDRLSDELDDWVWSPSAADADIVGVRDGQQLMVRVKKLQSRRIRELLGEAAIAALEAQREHTSSLVVMLTKRLGKLAHRELSRFMLENAPLVGWAVLDESERLVLKIPTLGIHLEHLTSAKPLAATPSKGRSLYSDLRRWMLKVLLLNDVPERWWGGPRLVPANAADLARIARVTPPTAWAFVKDFQEAGLIRQAEGRLEVPNRRRLFEHWFQHEQTLPRPESVPVKGIFGQAAIPPQTVLAGFAACDRLGVLHTPLRTTAVYAMSALPTVLESAELASCPLHQAELLIMMPTHRVSIQRGAVEKDGVRVADILQCALDMAFHPARGREQAEYIVSSALGWHP